MRSQFKLFSFLILFGVLPSVLRASLLIDEPFTYSNGALVSVSGGNWSTHSGTTGEVGVVSGRVNLQYPASEDVNRLIPGQPYTSGSSTKLYVSFTVNFSSAPTGVGDYFAHVKGSSTSNYRSKVFAFGNGAGGAGFFRLGLSCSANSPAVTNTTVLTTNTDYRIYLAYTCSNGVVQLWIDPTSELSSSVTATDAVAASSIIAFALRQDTGIGVLEIDDLRVGTSFADVFDAPVTNPPVITQQPASAATVEGGAATFVAAASGTAPLSYQWRFNNSPITGATNTSLTLTGVTTNQAGQYSLTVTNAAGSTNSAAATLTVIQPNASGTLSLVHYNVKGNFASDWSTNAAQVQAIARQLRHLNPDIISLNEIPNGLRHEMTNWMTAFFPSYQLAVSPGTDGTIRSGFISRFPIVRTNSWLLDAGLTNFGYNGTYTRDLFEAEITVPGATEPLHIFNTHLKSGNDADSQQRRAAECNAVSNFFVTVFLPTNGWRPYLLAGDLNEDIQIAMSQNLQAIQRLTNNSGLKLTTPLNPFTLQRFTHSIQGVLPGSMDARFDYIMPAGVLASNIVTSQVFRTDQLQPPLPLNLNSNDDIVASDHLPVQMIFNYPDPPLLVTLTATNSSLQLKWPALIGRRFTIQTSTNLVNWTTAATNLTSLTAQQTWTTPATNAARYFRVLRVP